MIHFNHKPPCRPYQWISDYLQKKLELIPSSSLLEIYREKQYFSLYILFLKNLFLIGGYRKFLHREATKLDHVLKNIFD